MRKVKSIFLVEDDRDDQEFFVEALNTIENTSLFGIANNGEEALEKLNNTILPDVIFMDIQMPRMNGIECLTFIVQKDEIKNIPVIILSTEIPQIDTCRALGARGFIEKPSDNRVLRTHLEIMINTDHTLDLSKTSQNFTTIYCPTTAKTKREYT